jgi:hypothetical protein
VAVVLLIWVACGVAGWKIGDMKGRPALGAVLGVLLGLIGLLIIACIPSKHAAVATTPWTAPPVAPHVPDWVTCPTCGAPIVASVARCPHCSHDVMPTALLPPPPGTPTGWFRDPSGRYDDRYWDGERWTEWTRNGNDYLTDPPMPNRSITP